MADGITKNVWVGDLALIELDRQGRTDAPPDVLQELRRRGYLTLKGDKPAITAAGCKRAARLKDVEKDLRRRFTAGTGGRCPLTTAAGGSLRT